MQEPSEKQVTKPKAVKREPKAKSPLEQSAFFTLFARHKLHHNQIADILGLSRVALMTKKKDPNRFYVRELLSLAGILGVSPQEMLDIVLDYIGLQQSLEQKKPEKKSKKPKEKE